MPVSLRVLFVEDSQADVALITRTLRQAGFHLDEGRRVETADGLRAALRAERWDLVVSDYRMPEFSAPEALAVLKESGLDLPFLVISGTVDEETAVEVMRAGAHDFIGKHKLARLVPALERELREATLRAEQTKLRQQLMIADRMASVGTLAAGVAHEINNPLATVTANIELVYQAIQQLRDGGADDPATVAACMNDVLEMLRDMREASERVRVIARDLKVFSRSGDEEKRGPVALERVVESALRMVRNEFRHRARLVKDYHPVPPVWGNEWRLGQVVLNLLVNAAQALPEGDADRHEIRTVLRKENAGAVLEVHDTGSGIPKELLTRIFDPFFSTKPIGVGTGLGLAICQRIVSSLGGSIDVESEVGVGSTFRITLPFANEAVPDEPPAPPAVAAGRRGRILVIDDEAPLGRMFNRVLGGEHELVIHRSAREALDRIRTGERFDIILCDLMMPEVTGMDVHAEVVRLAPEQAARMVFVTGGAFTPRAREFLEGVPNPRLEKPFDPQSLRGLVAALLR